MEMARGGVEKEWIGGRVGCGELVGWVNGLSGERGEVV